MTGSAAAKTILRLVLKGRYYYYMERYEAKADTKLALICNLKKER